jgi:uncharacterized membrane protein YdbT with pleckstrin-like domain
MSYADNLLSTGEHVVYRGRQHWLAPVSDSLRPILLVLAGLVVFFLDVSIKPPDIVGQIMAGLSAILLIAGLVWTGIVYFTWRAQEYLITNRRVLKVEGLLDKKSGDSSLEKINDAVLSQGLLARLFKFGNLEILTANEEAIDRYEMLAQVVDFKKAMLNAKNQLDDSFRRSGPAPAAAAAAPSVSSRIATSSDDVTVTLTKLADLRDKGAITPAEYEAKKAELLGRL